MTTARPILVSAGPLSDAMAERLGYLYAAICWHCHEAIVILNSEPPYMVRPPAWRHRDHKLRRTCRADLVARQRDWDTRYPELYAQQVERDRAHVARIRAYLTRRPIGA